MRIVLFDRLTYQLNSKREYTDEGFLKVPGRVARTGIQDYTASELNLDGDPNRIVKVFRPSDEVFKDKSLNSYNLVDITDDHPSRLIDSNNFKAVTVGLVASEGTKDGDFVVVDLIIKDASTIKLVESGKAQLSAGYEAEYINEPGITDDGIKYEFVQRDIKINHVAVVNNARAGSMARIFDHKPEVKLMRVTLDNGRAVEVDEAVGAQVEDCIKRLSDEATKQTEEADKQHAKADVLEDENEELKKKSSDDAISKRVADVAATMTLARKIAGNEFTCDSVSATEIKRSALSIFKKEKDYSESAPAYIEVAFDMEVEAKEMEDEDEEEAKKKATDSHKQFAADMATAGVDKDKLTSKQNFHDSLNNSWKRTLDGGDK